MENKRIHMPDVAGRIVAQKVAAPESSSYMRRLATVYRPQSADSERIL